jgi:hypothetical protein
MVAGPFFCLKIGRLICRLWHFAQWLGRPLAYRGSPSAICQGALPNMPLLPDFGRFFCDVRNMPTVTQPLRKAGLWIRIDLIQIRIQHFCSIWIQNRIRIQAKTEILKTISFSNFFEIKI